MCKPPRLLESAEETKKLRMTSWFNCTLSQRQQQYCDVYDVLNAPGCPDNNNHYENMPKQYTDFFSYVKKTTIISLKCFVYFVFIFSQNIDWGNTLEPPRRDDCNEYPQSVCFGAMIRKILYSCIPRFSI